MRLHELTIPIGKKVNVSLVGLDYKSHELSAQLLGYQSGQSVLVSLEAKPGQVLLHTGLKVKVTAHLPEGVLSFDSEIGQVCESPFLYLHLEYPYRVEFQHLRAATRIPVDTPVQIKAHTDLGMTSGVIHGHMIDVSTLGARLVVEKELTAMVTKITVGVMLSRDNLEHDMTLIAKIRRQCELSDCHTQCSFAYGVEFIEMDLIDDLFLQSFCQHNILNHHVLLC